jgi:hypothetical protein
MPPTTTTTTTDEKTGHFYFLTQNLLYKQVKPVEIMVSPK